MDALKAGKFKAGPGNAGRERFAHKVGLKMPNPWGLYDMHGNVAEWCSDGLEGGYYRVLRGGGWRRNPDDCRSAYRRTGVPSVRVALGFRVARSQSAQ